MCPYKRVGWKIFQNLINGEVLIRAGRVENFPKINKRASPFIRQVRVPSLYIFMQSSNLIKRIKTFGRTKSIEKILKF